MGFTEEKRAILPQPNLTQKIQKQVDNALKGTQIPSGGKQSERGPWEEYGLTREQARDKALRAIKAELGTLAAHYHEKWNDDIERLMLQGDDPRALWAVYRKLVKADTRLELGGETLHPLHPDSTPELLSSKGKSESPFIVS